MIGLERFIAYRMTLFDKHSFTAYILKFAVAALALSVAVMIIATSVIQGFKNEISQKMFDFWGHIVITDARSDRSFELIPILDADELIKTIEVINKVEGFRQPAITDDGFRVVNSRAGVKEIYPFSVIPAIISRRDEFEGILLKGVDQGFVDEMISPYLTEGILPSFMTEELSREIIISEQTAERMKLNVNDQFIVNFILDDSPIKKRFRVSGIYRSGLEEYDQRFAFFDHRWVQDLMSWKSGQYAAMEVHLDDIDDLDIMREYIYLEVLPSHLYAESIKSRSSEIFEWLELQNINEKLILTLMTLVGVVNMITAFLIFTLERTRMIGLLKSLGSTDWLIRKIFLLSSGFIMLRGIFFGALIGLGLCLIQKFTGIIKLSEKDYYLSQVPIEIDPLSILLIGGASLLVTMIFLIIPSGIISRISPVSALQFK